MLRRGGRCRPPRAHSGRCRDLGTGAPTSQWPLVYLCHSAAGPQQGSGTGFRPVCAGKRECQQPAGAVQVSIRNESSINPSGNPWRCCAAVQLIVLFMALMCCSCLRWRGWLNTMSGIDGTVLIWCASCLGVAFSLWHERQPSTSVPTPTGATTTITCGASSTGTCRQTRRRDRCCGWHRCATPGRCSWTRRRC